MPHVFGKLLTKATTLLEASSQSEVCTRSYGLSKLRDSQFENFETPNLGVSRQNDIWVDAPLTTNPKGENNGRIKS